ncbi:MAG: sensor domain-containing diguanylate cyclase, partial [Desulfovibrio sp.]|nr:sensor domain-containing diguanylate cyclase [Desulfovibrio sp.]
YIHPDDLAKVTLARGAVTAGEENGDTYECTYRMRGADGEWMWIFDRGYVTWRDKDGKAGHAIGSITNITTAQAGRDHLEALVRHDALTGVRSRAYCNLEIEHIEQNKIRPVTVLSFDITGLKMINDSLGHAMGDESLTRAATIIRNSLRATDCIARMGGDEFIVILANCNEEKGRKILDKIKKNFDAYNQAIENLPVRAGAGMATITRPEESMRDAMAKADERMYQDKRAQSKAAREAIKNWINLYAGKEISGDDRTLED